MNILILNKKTFGDLMVNKGINSDNVEDQTKWAFICCINSGDKCYFSDPDKKNVKLLISERYGQNKPLSLVLLTNDQAEELFKFIEEHKNVEGMMIADDFISRSTAIGTFLNEYLGGTHQDLEDAFPNNKADKNVLNLLRQQLK